MDVWFNNNKVTSLPLKDGLVIKDIKNMISDWLVPQGIVNYDVRLIINKKKELDPIVFNTSNYDNKLLLSKFIDIYISESIKLDNNKLLNYDVIFLLIQKLPGPSVISLCNTNSEIRQICQRNENQIYKYLLERDYPLFGNIDEKYKEDYIYTLREYGPTYVADVTYHEGYPRIGDKLRVPRIGEARDRYKPISKFAVFHLYNMDKLSPGTKYWAYVYFKSDDDGETTFFVDHADIRNTYEDIFEYNDNDSDELRDTNYVIESYGRALKVYQIKQVEIV